MKRISSTAVATFFAFLAAAPGVLFLVGCGDAHAKSAKDRAAADAFSQAARVFRHPRCVNCHIDGDTPLVGDHGQMHPMNVERGPLGMGKDGLWCTTCHQERNMEGAHQPPGAPEWRLPPPETPMVFQKKTARQLCQHLKDPSQNGSRSVADVVRHVREAPLVLWAWHPGEGRTPVPMSHEEFVGLMTRWAQNGAACPR